jgi:hypothetical protein
LTSGKDVKGAGASFISPGWLTALQRNWGDAAAAVRTRSPLDFPFARACTRGLAAHRARSGGAACVQLRADRPAAVWRLRAAPARVGMRHPWPNHLAPVR